MLPSGWASRSIPAWAGKPVARGNRQSLGLTGPSPRGRGNHRGRSHPRVSRAWAGKPKSDPGKPTTVVQGPSPRGRGNLDGAVGQRVHPRVGGETLATVGGSIPAWAGKPVNAARVHAGKPVSDHVRVHPRVGGETRASARPSPRGRWRAWDPHRSIPAWAGKPHSIAPSPRGRALGGSIPAWAGKPRRAPGEVHPRVGGETGVASGPSPRGRGNRTAGHPFSLIAGSIPAWAGKPSVLAPWGPSPRGRGNPGHGRMRCAA